MTVKSRIQALIASMMRSLTEDIYGSRPAAAASDRRIQNRFQDGAITEIRTREGANLLVRIVDVSSTGARLWAREPLPIGSRVLCSVTFARTRERLGMRVLWENKGEHGYEYGVRYAPVVPGTESLMDNYFHHVLNKRAA